MKKQLLFIVSIIVLALFAGNTNVSAQCASDGFHPAANQPYEYIVLIDPAGGYQGSGIYTWYVTQDVNIINGASIIPNDGTYFTVDGGLSAYNSTAPTGTSNILGLTWTPAAVGSLNPFFLVLRYRESNPNATEPLGCSAENIRVWQIFPINTFLLAVNSSFQNGTPFANATTCAADVIGAQVNGGGATVTYTYGTNTLYYTILASGYTGDWTPSIELPALTGAVTYGQNYLEADWTSDLTGTGTWVAFTGAAGSTGGQFQSPTPATILDPVAGTPILIRVQIANVNYETLADQAIEMGVDGLTAGNQPDIIGGAGPNACDPEAIFGKKAIYTILARPTVNAGSGTFITQTP
jgi:hypothetical protein